MKNWLKGFIPSTEDLKQHKTLRLLGSLLHIPELWRVNRHTVPKAAGIGVFCAFMPMPFQMLMAGIMAVYFRANLALSIAFVWVSNPFTMPPMFYMAYKLGKKILNAPDLIQTSNESISFTMLMNKMHLIWEPFLIGTLICGIVFGIATFFIAKWFWILSTFKKHKKRQRKT